MLVLPRQSGLPSSPGRHMDQGYDPDNSRPHRHLVQSPYNVPVLPPLRDSGSGLKSPVAIQPSSARKPLPEPYYPPHLGAGRTISPPLPLREWPYVLPTDPSQASVFPATARQDHHPHAVTSATGATGDPYQPEYYGYQEPGRKASDGTTLSSTTGDEQDKAPQKKKKRSSKLSDKVKSAVKDLFTRDDKDEPYTPTKRAPDSWLDEDY